MPVSVGISQISFIVSNRKVATLARVTVTLVAREAVALVAPDIVGTVCEHITGSGKKFKVIQPFTMVLLRSCVLVGTLDLTYLYLHSFSSGIEQPLPPQPSLQ